MHLSLPLASQLKFQDVLTKCTSDFHSQVNCTSKIVLAKRDLWLSLTSQLKMCCYPSAHPRTCYPSAWLSLFHKPAHCWLRSIRDRLATLAHLFLWCSTLAHVSLILPVCATSSLCRTPLCYISFHGAVLSLMWAWYCHFSIGSVRRTPTVGWIS